MASLIYNLAPRKTISLSLDNKLAIFLKGLKPLLSYFSSRASRMPSFSKEIKHLPQNMAVFPSWNMRSKAEICSLHVSIFSWITFKSVSSFSSRRLLCRLDKIAFFCFSNAALSALIFERSVRSKQRFTFVTFTLVACPFI